MKVYLIILTLLAFLQTSFLEVNLILLLITARSLILDDKENYLLAFIAGIVLGVLFTQNIGYFALVFLVVVKLIQLIKKFPFKSNIFTVLTIGFFIFLLFGLLEQIFLKKSLNFTKTIVETMVFLPTYILVKIWEDRFVVKSDIKLKLDYK